MKTIRENLPYILLVLIAIILVIITISLQTTIISNQQAGNGADNASNKGLLYTLRERIALAILPATLTPPPTPTAPPTAIPTVEPTATPLPPATATLEPPTPVPPTPEPPTPVPPTPVPPTPVPPTPEPPTPVPPTPAPPTPAQAVATPVQPTVVPPTVAPPTPQPAAPAPTNTVGPRADFRLGYVDRGDNCQLVTQIMQLIFERQFKLKTETVAFSEKNALFDALAVTDLQSRVDLTFCYVDPEDRESLQKHFGYVILVGGVYRQSNGKNFIVLSNSAVKAPIERDLPCVYKFLKTIKIDDQSLSGQTADGWLAKNSDLVATWTTCK